MERRGEDLGAVWGKRACLFGVQLGCGGIILQGKMKAPFKAEETGVSH